MQSTQKTERRGIQLKPSRQDSLRDELYITLIPAWERHYGPDGAQSEQATAEAALHSGHTADKVDFHLEVWFKGVGNKLAIKANV